METTEADPRAEAVAELAELEGLWRLLDALADLDGDAGELLTAAELWRCSEAARVDRRLAVALAYLGMAILRRERRLPPREPARRRDPHVDGLLAEVEAVAADPEAWVPEPLQLRVARQHARDWRRAPAAALAPAVLRVRLGRPLAA